jgi:hypothetical protein
VAHVEIDTYPFQVALQNIQALLHEVVQSHVLPFKSLIVQSYPQMQFFFIDQLHEQEFSSLLVDAPLDVG